MNPSWRRQKRKKIISWIIVIALIFVLVVLIAPWWSEFVENDYAETCYDARYWTGIRYQKALLDEADQLEEGEELDYEQILRDVVAENFSYTLDENLISEDLCRGGGVCTFVIDEETHGLSTSCSIESHIWYDDSDVTEEQLDKVTW